MSSPAAARRARRDLSGSHRQQQLARLRLFQGFVVSESWRRSGLPGVRHAVVLFAAVTVDTLARRGQTRREPVTTITGSGMMQQ
jgi:hypothetical protein